MAILDKQGLQHYANKMCNADNRKVGSKSLPTALNDIDIAIDGFKTLFETEYGTPVNMELENNENVFSIGTGTNVDRRSEVENSFTDVELSGNSLVNLIQEKSYLDWHVLYCGRKSSEGIFIGRGSKYSSQASPNNITSTDVRCKIISKNNSVYTLIFDAKVIEGTSSEFTIVYNGICIRNTAKIKDGRNVILIRSDDSQNGTFQIYEVTGDNNESDINIRLTNIVILEGDWTNRPIPQYFEGMKSVGEKADGNHKISISSMGKNIILDSEFKNQNGEWNRFMGEVTQGYSNNVGYTIKYSGTGDYYDVLSQKLYDCNTNQNNILPNTWYTLSFYAKGNIMRTHIYPSLIDTNVKGFVNGIETTLFGDGYYAHNLTNEWTKFTYTFKTKSQIPYRDIGHSLLFRAMPNSDCVISCLILEQGKTATEYKPQEVNKKEISLNEPLRGLPNGVKDTIEKVNGEWKIVRKVGSIVLNGSEPWKEQVDGSTEEFLNIRCGYPTLLNRNRQNGLCDKFNYITKGSPIGEQEGIQLYTHTAQSQFIASMSKSRFSTVDSFKEYLAQNHTTVLYELVTPIIEDISPITLQCWKNGTISIDEVIPVETTHTVALNKSAQIQKNIEELTALRNRVKALEEQYDKTALNQAYEVELLRLDMQLDNII